MLQLAIKSGLPLIYIQTDDIIHVQEVLTRIAGEAVLGITLPEVIGKISEFKGFESRVAFTSSECKSMAKLYNWAVDKEKTIIFVNTEKSVLQFDGDFLIPPKEMILEFLLSITEDLAAETLLPCFGGLTLKDCKEIAQLSMTRDGALTPRGVNETRRCYVDKLRGITQVDTAMDYYVSPVYLDKWMATNAKFFIEDVHPALVPRGILCDGVAGTGKTTAAKHIAATFGVPLYRLDLGSMMGKYVGESEQFLNAALAQVDSVAPCTVIFDEVEKVFQSTSDSGVTSRLLSQLLWWLQEHKSKVFVVMTTNAVGKIPEELHREGRIDATLTFLGVETVAEGTVFAMGSFEVLMAGVGVKVTKEHALLLGKRVKSLYLDKAAVPQSKLTQLAHEFVRTILVEAK